MSEIKLTKRFPESRPEDITEAYMRGYEAGRGVRETCEDVSENPLRFECSACGGLSLDIAPRYCPACGAEVKL